VEIKFEYSLQGQHSPGYELRTSWNIGVMEYWNNGSKKRTRTDGCHTEEVILMKNESGAKQVKKR
jgi:hypothetical protein